MPKKYIHKTEFRHSQETKAKIGQANKGHEVSTEARTKISQSRQGRKNPNFGKNLSPEIKEKISLSKKYFFFTHPEFDNAHNRGKSKTIEQKQRMSEARCKCYEENPEVKKKIGLARIGMKASTEVRKKQSESHKQLWRNPEYVAMKFRQYSVKPTKGELALQNILQGICPNQFRYNGDCNLGIILNGFIPDFVNVNGKKQVIEFFGSYWHQRPNRGETERINRYLEIGWNCLVIWDTELKDTEALENKIRAFVGGD